MKNIRQNKKGAIQMLGVVLLIGLAVLVGLLIPRGGGQLATVGDGANAPVEVSPVCSSTTTPQVTFSAYDVDQGTTLTGDIEYKINNGALAHVATGTAITNIKPNDLIEYVAGANAYYNMTGKVIVPCNTAKQENLGMKAYSTSPTVTVINSDGVTSNTASAAQALGANDEQGILLKLQAEANKYVQSPILIFEYNGSAYKNPLSVKPLVETPGFYTVNATADKVTSFALGADLAGSKLVEVPVTLRSLTNSGATDTIEFCLKDQSWYVDELGARSFKFGASDENQVAQAQSCASPRGRHIFVS